MKKVLAGIDVLRLLAFASIAYLHSYQTFYEDVAFQLANHPAWNGWFIRIVHFVPRALPFSGLTIVAIFAFLAGFRRTDLSLRRLYPLFALGILLLFLMYSDPEWDVYHYLVVTLLSLTWISKSRMFTYLFGALGLGLTFVPFWEFLSVRPEWLAHALVGVCEPVPWGGWPLLPWIGIPWAFFAFGRLVALRPDLGKLDLAWPLPLLAGTFTWGALFPVPIDDGFYCFIFRQDPLTFWGHFVWIAFLIRLSAAPELQRRLEKLPFLPWISSLRINRSFGLAYLVQLLLLWLAKPVLLPLLGQRAGFYLLTFLLLPATELTTRQVAAVWKKFRHTA